MMDPPKKRGWVEIMEGWGHEIRPRCYEPRFHVYDWTEHKDSGALVGDFATRREALAFAVNWAVLYGRKLQTAEVSHFPIVRKGDAA